MEIDFVREITHNNYKNVDKLRDYYHRIDVEISVSVVEISKGLLIKKSNKPDRIVNDKYIYDHDDGNMAPIIYGGASLIVVLIFLFSYESPDSFDVFLSILCSFLTVIFFVYLITKPKKERIFNRRDGLITMTGFFWQKNITMPFDNALFAYLTDGEDVIGAFQFQFIRPKKYVMNTFDEFAFLGNCYETMSFLAWYMDKNRPLPPGRAFDPYRQKDYERRKAEGFPRPLYPSNIPTPEATPEQQKERNKIGKW